MADHTPPAPAARRQQQPTQVPQAPSSTSGHRRPHPNTLDATATTQAGGGITPQRPKRNQSIRKFLSPRRQDGESPALEVPSRGLDDAMDIGEDESPSRPANGEARQGQQQGQRQEKQEVVPREEHQREQPADKAATAPVGRDGPTTPIHRPRKRPREDEEGQYTLADFSLSEDEEAERILSNASSRTITSPTAAPAATPTRHSGAPSKRTRLGETRRRILDSNTSLARDPTTPQGRSSDAPQPQTPHANIAASINADIISVRALVSPRLDAPASAKLETLLARISAKAQNGETQRGIIRGALDKMGRDVAQLKVRNTALENDVRGLREERVKARGKIMEVWKET